jgi:hypothetical protein
VSLTQKHRLLYDEQVRAKEAAAPHPDIVSGSSMREGPGPEQLARTASDMCPVLSAADVLKKDAAADVRPPSPLDVP